MQDREGGTTGDVIEHLDEIQPGDIVEFEISGEAGINSLEVTDTLLEPPFPPADVAEEIGEEQLPGEIQAALVHQETRTRWCFSQKLTRDGLEGPIEAAVKACIDVRHPPRYRWSGRGTVENLEVVA